MQTPTMALTEPLLVQTRATTLANKRPLGHIGPYGPAQVQLAELLFAKQHPYHRPVSGLAADLKAATTGEVQAFWQQRFGPAVASVVVAGDFDTAQLRPLLQRFFGPLPSLSKAPSQRSAASVQPLDRVIRKTVSAPVRAEKVIMAWRSPAAYSPGDAELELVAIAMATGPLSRLHQALVKRQKLAQEVSATQHSLGLSSFFTVEAEARAGVSAATLEKAIDLELRKLRRQGFTQRELDRARTRQRTVFVQQLQSLRHRAGLLNRYQSYRGKPDYLSEDLRRFRQAKRPAVNSVLTTTLAPRARVILRLVPLGVSP